jgi:hypothetical protein
MASSATDANMETRIVVVIASFLLDRPIVISSSRI